MSRFDPFLTSDVPDSADTEDDAILDFLSTPQGEDDAYDVLESQTSPGEAARLLDNLTPIPPEEVDLLEAPGFSDLSRVDDALNTDDVRRVVKRGRQSMDAVLEDAVYGDTMDKDEKLELRNLDTDPDTSEIETDVDPQVDTDVFSEIETDVDPQVNENDPFEIETDVDPQVDTDIPSEIETDVDPLADEDDLTEIVADPVLSSNVDSDEISSDVGWGIPGLSVLKKIAKAPISLTRRLPGVSHATRFARRLPGMSYAERLAKAPLSAAKWATRKSIGLAKRFVPKRDVNKVKILRNLNKKLVVEHANWLALQDQRRGRRVGPMSTYRARSKPWARRKIAEAGLPTSFKMRGADVLGADVLGADVVGVWWNPFSWFAQTTQVVIDRTKLERSPTGPDGQTSQTPDLSPESYPEEGASPEGYPQGGPENAYPDAGYPDAGYPDAGYPDAGYPEDYAQGDVDAGISGEDSLGAFAAEILSGPTPPPDLVTAIATKMKTGQPLSPGEVALLATSAKRNPRAKKLYRLLFARGRSISSGDVDESGAWLHKLNPLYWFKSSKEKQLIDTERQRWIENAETRKKLDLLEKAKAASAAAALAKSQAAATEAQLQAIEASLKKTASAGEGVDVLGHEKPTAISKVVAAALEKIKKKERAAELYAKILRGGELTSDELRDARAITRAVGRIKVVHGDLYGKPDPMLSALHGAFAGACLRGTIEAARKRNQKVGELATSLEKHFAATKPFTPDIDKAMSVMGSETVRLRGCVRAHASGRAYAGLDQAGDLRRSAVLGSAKSAMSVAEAKMLKAIKNLAAAGNPRAVQALKKMKQTGSIAGGDRVDVGFSISQAFKYATAPIWYPAKKVGQALKWTGRKLGILSKGSASPEQVRLNMLRAAAKRRRAAAARARAAQAQTEAEIRAQNAIAAAADAEADAEEAEAAAKEAAMMSKEAEADPELARKYAAADEEVEDTSGYFVGGWTEYAGEEDLPILGAAAEKSGAGKKIRAGSKVYRKAAAGNKKAKAAVVAMAAKAKRGEPQAKRDLAAVRAGRKAVLARKRAIRKQARALARKARSARVKAVRARLEAGAADKLVRAERKVRLHRALVVERKASLGNKKAKRYVAAQVALAKKGDPKAKQRVAMLELARKVRKEAPNKRERRNLARAQSLVVRARRGNPKAVRQIYVIDAAARAGNPNAKRARKRLVLASTVLSTVAAGTPLARTSGQKAPKRSRAELMTTVARTRSRLAARSAFREELAAGAKAARALGDKKTAGELALAAASAPSATMSIKNAAAVVASKEAGNRQAKAAVNESLAEAKKGDPTAIKRMSHVMAAQTIDDVNRGGEVSQAVRDAANLQARIEVKDPAAIDEAKRITEAATAPNPVPEATAAAIALGAAAITSSALAAKPAAKTEYMAKVNAVPVSELPAAEAKLQDYAKQAQAGTISAEDGVVAVRLAERLGRPKLAAEIAAKAPPAPEGSPLSTMPDTPQAPIRGLGSLVKESLRAVSFSTRDPLANWREGVSSRASQTAVSGSGVVDESGWSPFNFFRSVGRALGRNLPIIAPSTALAASAASLVTALQAKKASQPKAPPAASKEPEAKKEAVAASPQAKTATAAPQVKKEVTSTSGADKTYRDYVVDAIQAKKISKRDFNRAVELQAGPKGTSQTKKAIGEKTLAFLIKKGVKVGT